MHTKAQLRAESEAEAVPLGKVPVPITDTKIVSPALALSLSGGAESPVPADSDVEQAIVQGTPRPSYTRRSYSKTRKSASQAPPSPRVSATRSIGRRRWPSTSNLAQARADNDSGDEIPKIDYGRASPDPPPEREDEQQELPIVQTPIVQAPQIPPSPSALFKRLRTTSFSPFASLRRSGLFGKDGADPDARSVSVRMASSESSSDDDDLSIASRRVWEAFGDRDSHSDEEVEHDRPVQDS